MDAKDVTIDVDSNTNNDLDVTNTVDSSNIDKAKQNIKPQVSGSIRRMKSGDDTSSRRKREGGSGHRIPSPSSSNNNDDNSGVGGNKKRNVDSVDVSISLDAHSTLPNEENNNSNHHRKSQYQNNHSSPHHHQHHVITHSDISTPALRGLLMQVEKSLYSTKTEEQLVATKKIRQLLSVEREYLIDDVIAHDLIPRLLSFLKRDDVTELQVEALWALTNVAAGSSDHARVLIQKGAIPALVGLMSSSSDEVLEQAVWVLGNLAGDGPPARDKVLKENALFPLLQIIHNSSKRVSLLRISTWALSNICDGQPQAYSSNTPFDLPSVLSCLVKAIVNDDTEVLSHVCWALSHLCDGPSRYVEQVVRSNVCQRLITLLEHRSWRVTKPALRTIGNIVCAEDEKQDYTQHIVQLNAVERLEKLVSHSNREIQKEACWTLSNIAAGSEEQIQYVLNSGVIPLLIQLISDNRTDQDVQIEACWVILNATSCGSSIQIEALCKCGCVAILCNLLSERSMACMALEGLEKVLKVGEGGDRAPGVTIYHQDKNDLVLNVDIDGASGKKKHTNGNGNSNTKNNKKKKLKGGDDPRSNAAISSNNNRINNNNDNNGNSNAIKDPNAVSEKPNRHAHLIDIKAIELVQKSADPVLSKRALNLWNDYFISCALCSKIFGKNARDSFYCKECKCMVCKKCDCTKFHLSYQLSQWDEMYAEEEAEKSNKAKAKKKKRKKKKQREKGKKKATEGEDGSASTNGNNFPAKNSKNKKKTSISDDVNNRDHNTTKPEVEEDDDNHEEVKIGLNGMSVPRRKQLVAEQTAINLTAADATSKDVSNGNDDYVDYLSQGGSIFELAKMLDDDLDI
jgi:importin subunit alpha-6/7